MFCFADGTSECLSALPRPGTQRQHGGPITSRSWRPTCPPTGRWRSCRRPGPR